MGKISVSRAEIPINWPRLTAEHELAVNGNQAKAGIFDQETEASHSLWQRNRSLFDSNRAISYCSTRISAALEFVLPAAQSLIYAQQLHRSVWRETIQLIFLLVKNARDQ
jgi:hypothetical protein